MFGRKKPAIGIDVGTHSIKVVELNTSGGVALSKVGYQEVPGPEERVEALNHLVQQQGLKGADVVSSVSGRSVIVRYVNVRKMDPSELHDAIRFEADKYIPFGIDEVVLDCQPVGAAENVGADEMKVLLVAVKRDLIDEHVSLLRSAGLNPVIIDVDSFALGNAHYVASEGHQTPGVRAMVDIGASKTNINVIESGNSLFTREVYVGGSDFSAEIARRMSVNPFEVEELKRNPGDQEVDLREAVQGISDDLGNEIRLSLDFFENEFDRTVEMVQLSGGGSGMVGLPESLQESFNKSTEVWDPTASFGMHFARGGEELFRERGPQMAIAIGLAARMGRN